MDDDAKEAAQASPLRAAITSIEARMSAVVDDLDSDVEPTARVQAFSIIVGAWRDELRAALAASDRQQERLQ